MEFRLVSVDLTVIHSPEAYVGNTAVRNPTDIFLSRVGP